MRYRKFIAGLIFVEAWLLLHICRVAILILPFRVIASKAGVLNGETPGSRINNRWIYEVECAIRRAVPVCIHRSKCYDQALAGAILLRFLHLPYTIYLGLDKQPSGLHAHAWLRCGNRLVTGKQSVDRFTVIASFSHQT